MKKWLRRAGLVAALSMVVLAPASAQKPRGGTSASSSAGHVSYPLAFDSLEVYLMTLVPPDGRGNVKNLALSAEQQNLRVDADVKLAGLPGFEWFGAFGFTHVTATGPMSVVSPGLVAWNVQTMKVAGSNVPASMWTPLLQKATKRSDTLVPFRVGQWVQKVDVEPTRLVLR